MDIVIFIIVVCCALGGGCLSPASLRQESGVYTFPADFRFGAATAAYQVEGAWDEDGKTPSIWDHLTHTDACAIKDCSNGDIAADSYHQVERDVEMLRELGVDHYRFSLAWPRILPTGFPDQINQPGVDYYNRLIDELLKYGIDPMVTIYHWDLPQKLQDLGGWANPHVVDWFADYARVVYKLFGDRVKYWITINEPRDICYQGYGEVNKAPMLNIKGYADYLCGKNLLVAHAKAYRIYEEEYKELWGGLVGIALSAQWNEPETEADAEAAEDTFQFEVGFYAHPIYSKEGDFPQVVRERVASKSAEQGFFRSRLPEFTADEVALIRGSADFLGINHYTTYYVYRNDSLSGKYDIPSTKDDIGSIKYQRDDWIAGASEWNVIVPWGFTKLLLKLNEEYDSPEIYITENGFSSFPEAPLEDTNRILYYREYLRALWSALGRGARVRGFAAWSLLDNFEWLDGYTSRFGLYDVDFSSAERTRTPRASAFMYKELVRTHTLDLAYQPDVTNTMTIDPGH